jgi:hypothetical protein
MLVYQVQGGVGNKLVEMSVVVFPWLSVAGAAELRLFIV